MPAIVDVWSSVACPVIGMLHLPPLSGAPRAVGNRRQQLDSVLRDAEALVEGGVHGLMLENFGDAPFSPHRVPASVVAEMTAIACAVRRRFELPLGINVLRNDGLSALAIAHAVEASFVRVNILCGTRLTDQGLMTGVAYELLRERKALAADAIRILADIRVKHSQPVIQQPVDGEAFETVERGGADGLIVTGTATGATPDLDELKQARAAVAVPVLVGSGVTADNVIQFLPHADGLIVGSGLKLGGRVDRAVDPVRVRELMKRVTG